MVQVKNTQVENCSFGRRYGRRLVSYVVICTFLAFVNWMTNPHYWWVLWVMAGWGLNLLIGMVCFAAGWEDKEQRL